MRLQKFAFVVLVSSLLPALPAPAEALQVIFKFTNGTNVASRTRGPGIQNCANGVCTTTVNIGFSTAVNGFTITCSLCPDPPTVVGEQSGSLERITISNAVITSPSNCGSPCQVFIQATSNTVITATNTFIDFPNTKSPGGQPAGVILSGFFIPGASATAPAGDKISVTGRAAGTNNDGTPRAINVINPIPRGTGDSPTSLASECSGNTACAFTATETDISFSDQMSETIQYSCPTSSPCLPWLRVATTVTFAHPGDAVDVPVGVAQSRTGSVEPLREELLPAPGSTTVKLAVVKKLSEFATVSEIGLDQASNGINPAQELILFRFGPVFSVALRGPESCRPLRGGKEVVCGKKLPDGGQFGAKFERLNDAGTSWRFSAAARDVDLTGTENPVRFRLDVVPVTDATGDTFETLTNAQFFFN